MNGCGTCDGCGKKRRDLQPCGRDYNGDPEAPALCFICRKEGERGRVFNTQVKRYLFANVELDGWTTVKGCNFDLQNIDKR